MNSQTKLRVWHIPQVPGQPFYVSVDSPEHAMVILNILAEYDLFQFQQKIKPDYTNVGGLEYWNEESSDWEEWHNEDDDDIGELRRNREGNEVFET